MVFIISRATGEVVDLTQTNQAANINMIAFPEESQVWVEKLWEEFGVADKPQRFEAILCFFSAPPCDYRLMKENPQYEEFLNYYLNQWAVYRTKTGGDVDVLGSQCICSQKIQKLFFIKNLQNGNILRVGSDCINKTESANALTNSFKKMVKLVKNCIGCNKPFPVTELTGKCCQNCKDHQTSEFSVCMICLKSKASPGHKRCNQCFEAGRSDWVQIQVIDEPIDDYLAQARTCKNCPNPVFGPAWKTVCGTCYAQGQQEKKPAGEANKNCEKCKQPFFADADWKKICPNCYKQNMKECSRCKKSFLPKFPKATLCYPCYSSQG